MTHEMVMGRWHSGCEVGSSPIRALCMNNEDEKPAAAVFQEGLETY